MNPTIDSDDQAVIHVSWERTEAVPFERSGPLFQQVVDVAFSDLVLPAVASTSRSLAPIISWWALLYSFPMLARYFPRAWTHHLDLDRKTEAVVLETCLDVAPDAVPGHIARAISVCV